MLKKRIIPCLDVLEGRTVKGVNFVGLKDAGDPLSLAKAYSDLGADELVFLDITASVEKRRTLVKLVDDISKHINIPFTVGGGISSLDDAIACLEHGADKVALNSAIVRKPELVDQLSQHFGSQCIVAAIDTKKIGDKNIVYTHGGRNITEVDTLEWVQELDSRGVGELLVTSMDHDGTKNGFANDLYKKIISLVNIPLIASGGAGNIDHFCDTFLKANVDAALAASIFHYNEVSIMDLKQSLSENSIPVRIL